MVECKIDDKPINYQLETVGLCGKAVCQRRPIITNGYRSPGRHKKGYPEEQVKILRYKNVPMFDGSSIVLVVDVGKKEEQYSERDVQQLTLLSEGMRRLIARKRDEGKIDQEATFYFSLPLAVLEQ